MKRYLYCSIIMACALASGCATCCNTFDYAYPSYGGNWERGDRFWGRVGSNLSGAGTVAPGAMGETVIEQPVGEYSGEVPIYSAENGLIMDSQYRGGYEVIDASPIGLPGR
jgi:hypothetical protein